MNLPNNYCGECSVWLAVGDSLTIGEAKAHHCSKCNLYIYNSDDTAETYKNCIVLRDTEDGEITVKAYSNEDANRMMREVANIICFSDCDDLWDILMIIYRGREVKYVGWQPEMVFEFVYKDTGDFAWGGCYPNWEH